MKFFYFVLFLIYFPVNAETKISTGKFDFNTYRDTRSYNTTTINLLADFNNRFQYASLVDYFGKMNSPESTESQLYYTEQNIRYFLNPEKTFAISSQAALQSGPKNDLIRIGLLANLIKNASSNLSINLFPIQLDYKNNFNWQIEYMYRILITQKLYLSGFADQNMTSDKIKWVTEHQFGYRFFDNFHAVVEFRLNENFQKKRGIGIGLEYLMNF